MGQTQTKPIAPPNEQHLWIQEPINPCFTGKSVGDVWDPQAQMSPAARAAGVRDMAWQALLQEVTDHVASFRKEKYAFGFLFGAIILGQVVSFALQSTGDAARSRIIPLLPPILAVVGVVNLLSIAPANQKVDAKIEEAVRGAALPTGTNFSSPSDVANAAKSSGDATPQSRNSTAPCSRAKLRTLERWAAP